jgi:hypothetical protein
VLITPTVLPELIVAAEDLQRRKLIPVVILLEAASFDGSPGSAKLFSALGVRGVPVCLVSCGADLARTLSEFSPIFTSQEVRTWQNPM